MTTRAELARRRAEEQPDRRVELPDAREARGQGELADAQVRRLEQHASRLGALRPGEGERTGADRVQQASMDVTLAVAEPRGEPADALAIDDAVGDQPHRATDEVGA